MEKMIRDLQGLDQPDNDEDIASSSSKVGGKRNDEGDFFGKGEAAQI